MCFSKRIVSALLMALFVGCFALGLAERASAADARVPAVTVSAKMAAPQRRSYRSYSYAPNTRGWRWLRGHTYLMGDAKTLGRIGG